MIKYYCDECGKEMPELPKQPIDLEVLGEHKYAIPVTVFRMGSYSGKMEAAPKADLCKKCLLAIITKGLECQHK